MGSLGQRIGRLEQAAGGTLGPVCSCRPAGLQVVEGVAWRGQVDAGPPVQAGRCERCGGRVTVVRFEDADDWRGDT